MGVRIRQIEAQLHPPLSFQGHDRLHGHALLAEIQNHATRNPIKTGKHWPMHLIPQATASLWNHFHFTLHVSRPFRTRYPVERNDSLGVLPRDAPSLRRWTCVPMIGAKTRKRKYLTGFSASRFARAVNGMLLPDLPDISFRKRKTDNCLFDNHFPHAEFIQRNPEMWSILLSFKARSTHRLP